MEGFKKFVEPVGPFIQAICNFVKTGVGMLVTVILVVLLALGIFHHHHERGGKGPMGRRGHMMNRFEGQNDKGMGGNRQGMRSQYDRDDSDQQSDTPQMGNGQQQPPQQPSDQSNTQSSPQPQPVVSDSGTQVGTH